MRNMNQGFAIKQIFTKNVCKSSGGGDTILVEQCGGNKTNGCKKLH